MDHEESISGNPLPQQETGINSKDLDLIPADKTVVEQEQLKKPEPETGNTLENVESPSNQRPTDKNSRQSSCFTSLETLELKEHLPINSDSSKYYSCERCDYKCSESKLLGAHVQSHNGHSPKSVQFNGNGDQHKSYSCSFCNYTCINKSVLRDHIDPHEGAEKHYSCNSCNYVIQLMQSCHLCNFMDARLSPVMKHKCRFRDTIENHLGSHSEKPVENQLLETTTDDGLVRKKLNCDACSFCCKDESTLKEHAATHLRTRKQFSFHSEECSSETINHISDKNQPLETTTDEELVRKLSCDLCSFRCTDKSTLEEHAAIHTETKEHFSCSLCNYKSTSRSTIDIHLKTHDEECSIKTINPIVDESNHSVNTDGESSIAIKSCDISSFQCRDESILKEHAYTFPEVTMEHFSCCFCNYKCTSRSTIEIHSKTHGKEGEKYESFELISPNGINLDPNKRYSCDLCNYRCYQEPSLRMHDLEHLRTSKHFSCYLCSFKTTYRAAIDIHLETHLEKCSFETINPSDKNQPLETNDKELVRKTLNCYSCSFNCIDKSIMEKHAAIHTKEPFSCGLCNYKSISRSTIDIHLKTHDEDRVDENNHSVNTDGESLIAIKSCDSSIRCRDESILKEHAYTYPEVTMEHFSCCLCNFKCTSQSTIETHSKTHGEKYGSFELISPNGINLDPTKRFACELCNYRCYQEPALRIHDLIHSRTKRYYSCNLCNYKCLQRRTIDKHIKTHDEECSFKIIRPVCDVNQQMKSTTETLVVNMPFNCKLCPFSCASKSSFERHAFAHPIKKKHYSCDSCNYKCTDRSSIKAHVQTHAKTTTTDIHLKTDDEECSFQKINSIHDENQPLKTAIGDGLVGNELNCDSSSFSNKDALKGDASTTRENHLKTDEDCSFQTTTPVHDVNLPFENTPDVIIAERDSLSCGSCSFRCKEQATLEEHANVHAGTQNHYSCTSCNYKCTSLGAIENHSKAKHGVECSFQAVNAKFDREKLYFCELCNFSCVNESTLKNHASIHTGTKRHLSCNLCNYKCTYRPTIDKHLKTQHEEYSFETICPSFETYQSPDDTNRKLYSCKFCSFSCRLKGDLKNHVYIHDTGIRKYYSCDLCNYKCTSGLTIEKHIQTHDEECSFQILEFEYNEYQHLGNFSTVLVDNKSFNCELCNFSCVYESTLKNHASIHTGSKRHYSCTLCNYKCVSRRDIKVHIQTHDEECSFQLFDPESNEYKQVENTTGDMSVGNKLFNCELCNFTCVYESTLKNHASIHTGSKRHFSCTLCNYKCVNRRAIKIHIQTHNEECSFQIFEPESNEYQQSENTTGEMSVGNKLFHCELCSFSCIIESTLKNHASIHTGSKRHFSCTLCNYKCVSRRGIKIHKQTHDEECSFQIFDPECNEYKQLENPTVEMSVGNKLFNCELCNFTCVYESTLKNHASIHTESKKHYSCTLCNYKCVTRRAINIHIQTHDEECSFQTFDPKSNEYQQSENTTDEMSVGNKSFNCELCNFSCIIESTLKNHSSIHTESKRHFSCTLCNYKCVTRRGINAHIQTHDEECSFQIFDPKFNEYQQWGNATSEISVGNKLFHCELCSFSCIMKSTMKNHASIHTGSTRHFSCTLCNYKCVSRHTIKTHIQTHDEECFFQICDPEYNENQQLENTTSEIEVKNEQLENTTGKTVVTEKPFNCELCSFSCFYESTLQKHADIHKGTNKHDSGDQYEYSENQSANTTNQGPIMEHSPKNSFEDSNPDAIKTNKSAYYNPNRSSDFSSDLSKSILETENSNTSKEIANCPTTVFSKIYRCDLCPYKCRYNIEAINAHKDIHNGQSSKYYSCDTCDYKNLHSSAMKRHIKNAHGSKPIYTFREHSIIKKKTRKRKLGKDVPELRLDCSFCSYSCKMERDLNFHMEIHNGQSKYYSCDLCDYKCQYLSTIKSHVKGNNWDNHISSYKFNDPTIDKPVFSIEPKKDADENISNEASTKENEERNKYLDCHLCSFSCTSQEITNNHIKSHTERHTCYKCGFKSPDQHTFKAHVQTHDEKKEELKTDNIVIKSEDDESTSNKPYSCNFCTFVSSDELTFQSHLNNMHKQQISYACNVCSFTTSMEPAIENHMEIHLGLSNYYSCNLCDYLCETNRSIIKKHLLDQHGVTDECLFEYNLASSGFAIVKSEFNSDENVTNNYTNNFSCSQCNYSCRAGDELKLHEKIHSEETDHYSCNVCNYKCSDYVVIIEHSLAKHKDLQPPLFEFKTSSDLLPRIKMEDEEIIEWTDGSATNENSSTYEDQNSSRGLKGLSSPFEPDEVNYNFESDEECINKKVKTASSCNDSFSDNEVDENQDGSFDSIKLENDDGAYMNDEEFDQPDETVNLYFCPVCSYSCTAGSMLLKHLKIHDSSITSYCSCDVCGYKCSNRKTMDRHLQTHKNNNKSILPRLACSVVNSGFKRKFFYCEKCNYNCSLESLLPVHKKIHTGNAKHYYSCNLCNYLCARITNIKSHMQNSHNTQRRDFKLFKNGVESEMTDVSSAAPTSKGVRITCDLCNFNCASKFIMIRHMKIHTGKSSNDHFSCDLCNYKCAGRPTIGIHMKYHGKPHRKLYHVIRPNVESVPINSNINCTLCDYKCSSDLTLKIHMKAHRQNKSVFSNMPLETNKEYSCDQCSFVTSLVDSFDLHMKSHLKQYACDRCEFSSESQDMFQAHLKMHSEPMVIDSPTESLSRSSSDFKCEHPPTLNDSTDPEHMCFICGSSQLNKDEHKRHIDFHSSERFPCILCDSRFIEEKTFLEHMKSHVDQNL